MVFDTLNGNTQQPNFGSGFAYALRRAIRLSIILNGQYLNSSDGARDNLRFKDRYLFHTVFLQTDRL